MMVDAALLDSDEGNLRFVYALDYAPLTGKTLYRYRMNDSKWSAWSEKQSVEFLNMPYGSFTLYVQAQLANGKLSEVASIAFTIAAPLYMRWYMGILYLFVIGWLVYIFFRYRLKKLQRDKIKLEHIVQERTADLRNAQNELIRQEKMATVGKLTEGLIDRILNPMNYIINFSKMSIGLLNDLRDDIENSTTKGDDGQIIMDQDTYEDTADIIGMMAENLQSVDQYGQNTTRILKAMEEMLKDRSGGYVSMDLLPVLQQDEDMLNNFFSKERQQYGIRMDFTLPPGRHAATRKPRHAQQDHHEPLGQCRLRRSQEIPEAPRPLNGRSTLRVACRHYSRRTLHHQDTRQRHRHRRENHRQDFRPLLHHQDHWRGCRCWPLPEPRNHPEPLR
jgi:signal transduction histidine kinase